MQIQFTKCILLLLLLLGASSLGNLILAADREHIQWESRTITIEITVFENGNRRPLDRKSPAFALIQQQAETMFGNSHDALYELVTNQTIHKIKSCEMAVELIYTKPVVIEMRNPVLGIQEIKIDRLLIPLSGKYPLGTVFYGLRKYASGPVVYRSGTDKLRAILVAHGLAWKNH